MERKRFCFGDSGQGDLFISLFCANDLIHVRSPSQLHLLCRSQFENCFGFCLFMIRKQRGTQKVVKLIDRQQSIHHFLQRLLSFGLPVWLAQLTLDEAQTELPGSLVTCRLRRSTFLDLVLRPLGTVHLGLVSCQSRGKMQTNNHSVQSSVMHVVECGNTIDFFMSDICQLRFDII